jgi:putative toxin-antitoxin system antitoxin component (TIGR02293 family)
MSLVHIQMGDWLGFQPPTTETDVLRLVEGQLTPKVIQRLMEMGLERPEIDALIIPLRTLQHRRSKHEKLSIEESDRVIRLIRVLSAAETVYGSRERAFAWLRRPHPRLDGRNPLSLLRTDTGARIVEELLIQIDEGIFV